MQATGQEQPAEALGLFNFEEDNLTPTQVPGATSHPTKSLPQVNKKAELSLSNELSHRHEILLQNDPFSDPTRSRFLRTEAERDRDW